MTPALRSSVLVLSSTRPLLFSPLTAARASAASALGCVAPLVHAAALSLAAGSPCWRRVAFAARCASVARDARAAFVGARALLDPTLALLAADRGSSQRRLGAHLSRRARPRGGALARHHLATPAAARARCVMHAASLMAPVLRSSVLVLSSTRPLLCSPLTAAPSQCRLGARLRRCARPRGGALARRRPAMPAAARARCAMYRRHS